MAGHQPAISPPSHDRELFALLSQCSSLPSPVGLALRILEMSRDPAVPLQEIAKVISLDPALASKLLRLANSPLYARQRKTENIRQAINLFGIEGTITLALSFSVVTNLRERCRQGFDYQWFWRRSLAAATCAQLFAERLKMPRKEDMFIAGLLQDLGMLALAQVRTDLYDGLSRAGHDQLRAREREVLGVDHAAVGAWLLQQWNFPEHLQTLLLASHDPLSVPISRPEIQRDARVVAFSGEMAELWCHAGLQSDVVKLLGRAGNLLGFSHDDFVAVLESARAGVAEIADVFDIELDDPRYLETIVSQARELTMLRHIHAMQRSTVLERAAELLEHRTRLLEEENRRDTLTGLFNRAYLERTLREEIENANQHGWPFSVMFIDLDDFKTINDEYGHLAGDQVLRNTARVLMESTRGSDIVGRYGGEEFVILLPGAGSAAAQMSCERLLGSLRAMRHRVGGDQERVVTASVGIAVHGEGHRFSSIEELLKAADQALYAAKHQGRDQFVFHLPAG